jgi:hypothetical protein
MTDIPDYQIEAAHAVAPIFTRQTVRLMLEAAYAAKPPKHDHVWKDCQGSRVTEGSYTIPTMYERHFGIPGLSASTFSRNTRSGKDRRSGHTEWYLFGLRIGRGGKPREGQRRQNEGK